MDGKKYSDNGVLFRNVRDTVVKLLCSNYYCYVALQSEILISDHIET